MRTRTHARTHARAPCTGNTGRLLLRLSRSILVVRGNLQRHYLPKQLVCRHPHAVRSFPTSIQQLGCGDQDCNRKCGEKNSVVSLGDTRARTFAMRTRMHLHRTRHAPSARHLTPHPPLLPHSPLLIPAARAICHGAFMVTSNQKLPLVTRITNVTVKNNVAIRVDSFIQASSPVIDGLYVKIRKRICAAHGP